MSFEDIAEYCRVEALASKLYPNLESQYRAFCRQYSKTFHTPLHEVFSLDPELVMLAVFEENYSQYRLSERKEAEYIIEELRRVEDPNYDASQNQEFEEFAEGIEEWEDLRQASKAPIPHKNSAPIEKPEEAPPAEDTPKEGYLNLSYLEDSEDER